MLKHISAWLAVILLIGGIAGGLGLYKHKQFQAAEAAASASPEPSEAVVSVQARQGTWSSSTRAIGTVVALQQLEIRNELAGAVAEMGFTSGSTVEKGQLLVQFDVRQERAALAAAEAEVQLAKQTLDRREGLKESAAFSPQETDKARSEFAAATARAKNLEVAIDKKRITAPFRARVGITDLQPGAYLDVGTLIGRLQGLADDAFVDFSLPQDNAASLTTGSTVTLTGGALPSGTAEATITAEDDSIDGTNRSVRFRATAKGLGSLLRPGTFLDVTVVTSKPRDTILVPLTAVRRSPNGQHVYLLVEENGKLRARERVVKTGPIQGDEIAVEKGLAAGERIASSGSFKLRDGLLVHSDMPPTTPTPKVN